jgi:tRNA (guanine-N7-)-methyltransferase
MAPRLRPTRPLQSAPVTDTISHPNAEPGSKPHDAPGVSVVAGVGQTAGLKPDASQVPGPETRRTPLGADSPLRKTIKSYVLRAGRTTTGQARAVEELGPRFLLDYRAEPLDLTAAFGRAAPTVMEIGFCMGEATAHIAGQMPGTDFLCCEVHEPGVGALLKRIGEQGLENIRILRHDAVEVLDHMITPGSLAGVIM